MIDFLWFTTPTGRGKRLKPVQVSVRIRSELPKFEIFSNFWYNISTKWETHMAGWCNGSTPGSLPGDSVRVRACTHIAGWTSQFKSQESLSWERRGGAGSCYQGLFAPSKYANRARGWIVCSFRKLPPAEMRVTMLPWSFDMWLVIWKRDINKTKVTKRTNRLVTPMTYK